MEKAGANKVSFLLSLFSFVKSFAKLIISVFIVFLVIIPFLLFLLCLCFYLFKLDWTPLLYKLYGKSDCFSVGIYCFSADKISSETFSIQSFNYIRLKGENIKLLKSNKTVFYGDDVDISLKLSDLFLFKFIPVVENIENMNIFIYLDRDIRMQNKDIKNEEDKLDPVDQIYSAFDFINSILYNNFVNIKNKIEPIRNLHIKLVEKDKVIHNITIPTIKIEAVKAKNILDLLHYNSYNSVVFAGLVGFDGDFAKTKIQCFHSKDNFRCKTIMDVMHSSVVNFIIPNNTLLRFGDFKAKIELQTSSVKGSLEKQIFFQINGNKNIDLFLDDEMCLLKKIHAFGYFDFKERDLVISKVKIQGKEINKGEISIKTSFNRPFRTVLKISSDYIGKKMINNLLSYLVKIIPTAKNVFQAIDDNVSIKKGYVSLEKSTFIFSSEYDYSPMSMLFKLKNIDCIAKQANDLRANDVTGTLFADDFGFSLSSDILTSNERAYGNVYGYFAGQKSSFVGINVDYDYVSLLNILQNKSLPDWVFNLSDFFKINNEATIKGSFNMVLFFKDKKQFLNDFYLDSQYKIKNIKSYPIESAEDIDIDVKKNFKGKSLLVNSFLKKARIKFHHNSILKSKNENLTLSFDIPLYESEVIIQNISFFDLDNKIEVIKMDLIANIQQDWMDSKLELNIHHYNWKKSNFSGYFKKKDRVDYDFFIKGSSFDGNFLFYLIKSLIRNEEENSFNVSDLKLLGKIRVDNFFMLNDVNMIDAFLNIDFSDSIFHKFNFTSILSREKLIEDIKNKINVIPEKGSLFLKARKDNTHNNLYGFVGNTRLFLESLNLQFSSRFAGGSFSIEGVQEDDNHSIRGVAKMKDFFYSPDDDFNGIVQEVVDDKVLYNVRNFQRKINNKTRGTVIKNVDLRFNYEIDTNILQWKDAVLFSGIAHLSDGSGLINFKDRTIFCNGKLHLSFGRTGESFSIANIPLLGNILSLSFNKTRYLFTFYYKINGSFDDFTDSVMITPAKTMSIIIGLSVGAVMGAGVGIGLAVA